MAGKVLTPASSTAEIDGLKAANAADVAGAKTFVTQGVDNSSINRYLTTGEGKQYIQQLRQADPLASDQALLDRASDQLSTGTVLPTMNDDFTSPLVKLTPVGETPSAYSPFFTTQDELNRAIASGRPLGDSFGLPLSSQAPVYDIHQITPVTSGGVGPTIFSSPVAPTSELGGQFVTQGNATQYLVPNRGAWSDPVKLGSVPASGGVPIGF